jgi:RNA polymerase sigma-70 factor (ECF subfamily)
VDATSVDPSSLEPLAGPVVELDTALDVRATLTELTPAHRAVLILRDIDGLAEADVAALLELPEGTVKSRLHRARAAFARKWEA